MGRKKNGNAFCLRKKSCGYAPYASVISDKKSAKRYWDFACNISLVGSIALGIVSLGAAALDEWADPVRGTSPRGIEGLEAAWREGLFRADRRSVSEGYSEGGRLDYHLGSGAYFCLK